MRHDGGNGLHLVTLVDSFGKQLQGYRVLVQTLDERQRLLLAQVFIEPRRLAGLEQRAQVFAVNGGAFGDRAGQLVTARRGTKAEPFAERIAEAFVGDIHRDVAGPRTFIELPERPYVLQGREPRLRAGRTTWPTTA